MIIRFLMVAGIIILAPHCSTRNSVKITKKAEMVTQIYYSGGNGESFVEAIIINGANNKSAGISAEYAFITEKHGSRGMDWALIGQTVIREKNKIVDVVEIQLKDSSERRIYYFDVSDFISK